MRVRDRHLARPLKGACFPCVALRARSPPGPVPLAACALSMLFPIKCSSLTHVIASYFHAPAARAVAGGSLSWGALALWDTAAEILCPPLRSVPLADAGLKLRVHTRTRALPSMSTHTKAVSLLMPQFHGVHRLIWVFRVCSVLLRARLPQCLCGCQSLGRSLPCPIPRWRRAEWSVLAFAQGQRGGGRDPSSTTGSRYGCLHPLCPQGRPMMNCPVGGRSRM